jgi:hypothetical protein
VTTSGHLSSSLVFSGVRVTQALVFCVLIGIPYGGLFSRV